jgi:ectoine hydroxylase-related dioxygenase (phytanoyl-CoA dioxygenase family)
LDTQFYQENGYTAGIPVLDGSFVDNCVAEYESLAAAEPERAGFGFQNVHFQHRFAWEIATHPGILDLVSAILGPDIVLTNVRFLCKNGGPEEDAFFAWHQDVAYYGIEPPTAAVGWVALDESTVETGCLEVIPGSHRRGVVRHELTGGEGNVLRANQAIPAELVDESEAVPVEQAAGTVSFHDAALFHSSRPNRSGRRRCGVQLGFVSPSVKESEAFVDQPCPPGWRWHPFRGVLVRGEDRWGHLALREAPFPLPA